MILAKEEVGNNEVLNIKLFLHHNYLVHPGGQYKEKIFQIGQGTVKVDSFNFGLICLFVYITVSGIVLY